MLTVPYVIQTGESHCGAAALEMVFRYFNKDSTSQDEIFEKHKQPEPYGSGNFYIQTYSLVQEARSVGFCAAMGKAILANDDVKELLTLFINVLRTPLIVCQQFPPNPQFGHFRVVVGIEGDTVIFHDPHPEFGGESMTLPLGDFVSNWKETGKNVVGGIFLWVRKAGA